MIQFLKKHSVLLFSLLLMSILMLPSSTTYASTYEVTGAAPATRFYLGTSVSGYNIGSTKKIRFGGDYSSSTPEFVVFMKCSATDYSFTHVWIDGKHSEQASAVKFSKSGNYCYPGYLIRYLSPGKHKIELKSNGNTRTLNVIIPAYTDYYVNKALEKVKAGTASEQDYEVLSVNPLRIGKYSYIRNKMIPKLNEQIKGRDLTINDIQATVYDIIDQLNN